MSSREPSRVEALEAELVEARREIDRLYALWWRDGIAADRNVEEFEEWVRALQRGNETAYKQGYEAAMRERDLSPMGRSPMGRRDG